MPSNNFADVCLPSASGASCTCRQGYGGDRCERYANCVVLDAYLALQKTASVYRNDIRAKCNRCTVGYYGDPMAPGDYCKPCDCHGNADEKLCNTVSGQCYDCRHDTTGLFCETCVDEFFGTAENGNCRRESLHS